jgi:hypothetical protein
MRTTVPAYGIRSEYFYDGRELEHIEVYDQDELYCKMVFVHNDKKLTELTCSYFTISDTNNPILEKCCSPISSLVGGSLGIQFAKEEAARIVRQSKKGVKAATSVRYEFTWTDKNVTSVKCTDNEGVRNIVLTYDDKTNPYNQLFGFRELNDPIYGFEMLSENNILTILMPYGRVDNQMFRFDYEYIDDLPSSRVLTFSYRTFIPGVVEDVQYKVEKTETYTYLK